MRNDVVALYVDPRGPYPGLVYDWYDQARDARRYAGPLPVVAHPPCGRWSKLAGVVESRYGYRRGSDGGAFEHALHAVRAWGGVLEHPAESRAWSRFGLAAPAGIGWQLVADTGLADSTHGEWVCEVWQSAYGHRARKRTWLLYVGPGRPLEGNWGRPRGAAVISGMKNRCARPMSERIWASEAKRTPPAFAEWLLALAAQARVTHAESA